MSDFLAAFEKTMLNEGGYKLTNVSGDRGGQTYAGISRRFWPGWSGWEAIDDGGQPAAVHVRAFYKHNFWDKLRLDEVADQRVASTLYDFAVNAGVGTAAKLAQVVVGTTPDGRIGPVTIRAINETDPKLFVLAYALAKVARYRDIVAKDRTQIKFLLGWLNRTLAEVS